MALTPTVLIDARIYLASVDLTGFSNKVETAVTVTELDRTTFGSGGSKVRGGGLFDSKTALEGLWDSGDLTKPDDAFWANLGSATVPLTLVPELGTVGSLAYLNRVFESDYKYGGEIGKDQTWSADLKGNWPLVRGQILHPQGTARTATGTGTGVQLGSVAANQRLYACLHVLSVAGATPSLTVKVQSDTTSGFAAPTDRITFNAATALGGQASSALGAITDTWWRATWTISGTTPSFLFAVSAGVGPK